MPTYTYRCGDCGATVTVARTIAERDKAPYCATCADGGDHAVRTTRVLTAPGVAFRGPGFYSTERRRETR